MEKTQRSQKGVREVIVQAPDGFVLVVAVDVLVFPASPPVEDSLGFPFQVLYVRGDMNFTLMEAQLIFSISRRGTETLPGHRLPKELMELMASPHPPPESVLTRTGFPYKLFFYGHVVHPPIKESAG